MDIKELYVGDGSFGDSVYYVKDYPVVLYFSNNKVVMDEGFV